MHHRGGADTEEKITLLGYIKGVIYSILGQHLPEPDHVRPYVPAAGTSGRSALCGSLQRFIFLPALDALVLSDVPVKLDHFHRSCLVVEPVHVLGDQVKFVEVVLEADQCHMSGIGLYLLLEDGEPRLEAEFVGTQTVLVG